MSNYTLNLQVEGGDLSASLSVLTADSVEYITAAFTFDESWSDLLKTAIFRVGDIVYQVPLENDSCKIPFEALKEPMMYISVFGVLGDIRATTDEVPVQVQNSGYTVCEPKAPTPDPYNYFLEKVTELKNETALDVIKSAGNAESALSFLNRTEEVFEEVSETKNDIDATQHNISEISEQCSNILSEVVTVADTASEHCEQAIDSAQQAAESAKKAEETHENIMESLENHNSADNSLAHPNIMAIANEAKSIALGKANSLCFNTEEDLKNWVSGVFSRSDGVTPKDLKIGDNLYILELGVPDFWWDGTSIQPLGAEKPDFSDYYNKSDIDARISDISFDCISQSEYDSLYLNNALDAGRIYFVYEED